MLSIRTKILFALSALSGGATFITRLQFLSWARNERARGAVVCGFEPLSQVLLLLGCVALLFAIVSLIGDVRRDRLAKTEC